MRWYSAQLVGMYSKVRAFDLLTSKSLGSSKNKSMIPRELGWIDRCNDQPSQLMLNWN